MSNPQTDIKFVTYRKSQEDFENYLRRKDLTGMWARPGFYRVDLGNRTVTKLEDENVLAHS